MGMRGHKLGESCSKPILEAGLAKCVTTFWQTNRYPVSVLKEDQIVLPHICGDHILAVQISQLTLSSSWPAS